MDGEEQPPARAHAASLWRSAMRDALRLKRAEEAAHSWVDLATPSEPCVRHDYDAATGMWSQSQTQCKMEPTHFAEGAMRRCFRLLKQTQAPNVTAAWAEDWRHASAYVAKEYKDPETGTREAYERDCKMQQDAKLWGARYDKLRPPKPVDFLQCFLLEFTEREGRPIFACERVITGEYIKHNSNSGFVECHRRATPQAFSHYTYQASLGRLIVVDIQGVSDLYTDPQVHTLEGTGYGEGNLGVNGFALFFAAHRCSPLCAKLGLAPLPKSELELARDEHAAEQASEAAERSASASTSGASAEGSTQQAHSATAMVRTWRSADDARIRTGDDAHGVQAALAALRRSLSNTVDSAEARATARRSWVAMESARWITAVPLASLPAWALLPESWAAGALPVAAELRAARARRVSVGALARDGSADAAAAAEDSWVLFAPVHMALARYNACGGLPVLDGVPDEPSAVFHLCFAARGGDAHALEALRDLARGVVQDVVPGVRLCSELPEVTAALTAALARGGNLAACAEQADRAATASEKLAWLERAFASLDARSCGASADDTDAEAQLEAAGVARYQLLEKLGHARLVAGEAAAAAEAFAAASEAATLRGKGKLSLKLSMLAEEAMAQIEEGDEEAAPSAEEEAE